VPDHAEDAKTFGWPRALAAVGLVIALYFAWRAVAPMHVVDRDVLKLILWVGGPLLFVAMRPSTALAGVGLRPPIFLALVPGATAAVVMAAILLAAGMTPGMPSSDTVLRRVLAAGLSEEILFRGFLVTQLLLAGLRPRTAILISALSFGLAHAPNVWSSGGVSTIAAEIAITALGGAMFAIVMQLMSGSVIAAIALHAGMNLAWEIFSVSQDAIGNWSGLVARLAAIAAAIATALILRRRRAPVSADHVNADHVNADEVNAEIPPAGS